MLGSAGDILLYIVVRGAWALNIFSIFDIDGSTIILLLIDLDKSMLFWIWRIAKRQIDDSISFRYFLKITIDIKIIIRLASTYRLSIWSIEVPSTDSSVET